MNLDNCYKIGYILKPHGLKGGVTVSIDADTPNDFNELETVFLLENHSLVPYFVESVSVNGAKAFMKFEEVDTPEDAEKISKHALYLPKTERPKSGRGEFYDDEIVGFAVEDSQLGLLGQVIEVTAAGPNRLLAVMSGDREILIPINGPFITSINKARKKISVDLPDGFLDI